MRIETVGDLKKRLQAISDDVVLRFYGTDEKFEELEVVGTFTDLELDYSEDNDKNYLYLVSKDLG